MTAEDKARPQWPQIDDLYDPKRWVQPERAAKHAACGNVHGPDAMECAVEEQLGKEPRKEIMSACQHCDGRGWLHHAGVSDPGPLDRVACDHCDTAIKALDAHDGLVTALQDLLIVQYGERNLLLAARIAARLALTKAGAA